MKPSKITALISLSLLLISGQAFAEKYEHEHGNEHNHSHGEQSVYKGYFEDEQVKERPLSNWAGDWQSIYPYLVSGEFNKVMLSKAKHGDKTMIEYKEYYEVGYKTDVNQIVIEGEKVTFTKDDETYSANYVSDSYEILTYEKGNRGVRFIFKKSKGDDKAPSYIQFSDHIIAPQDSYHFHIYFGDDRAELLKEVTNWPTYFPSSMSAQEIADDLISH